MNFKPDIEKPNKITKKDLQKVYLRSIRWNTRGTMKE